jgi:hypothetical protein
MTSSKPNCTNVRTASMIVTYRAAPTAATMKHKSMIMCTTVLLLRNPAALGGFADAVAMLAQQTVCKTADTHTSG